MKNDESINICSADKGKAVVVEDTGTYMSQVQQQINEGDYELAKGNVKTVLQKDSPKTCCSIKEYGSNRIQRQKTIPSDSPVMVNMYILIKVHKKNFPGRAVVSQIHCR